MGIKLRYTFVLKSIRLSVIFCGVSFFYNDTFKLNAQNQLSIRFHCISSINQIKKNAYRYSKKFFINN